MSIRKLQLPLAGLVVAASLAAAPVREAVQEPGGALVEGRVLALEALVQSTGDAPLTAYLEAEVGPDLREARGDDDLLALLTRIRSSCRSFGGIMVQPLGGEPGFAVVFETPRGWFEVVAELEHEPPHQVAELSLEATEPPERPRLEPFTWETLDARLDAFEETGFRGSILVVRDGEVFLERQFGTLDPTSDDAQAIDASTAFAVGSMPIDFTMASILKLQEQGKLALTDPITRFLDDVPEDKRGITLEHLMSGTSGLQNFHGVRGVDHDMDLAWIDRATALERILGGELLFEPGRGQAHSHSAFGVLAAIVELVSGQSFIDFVREHFLKPAGMTRTGLYEDTPAFAEDVAMGTPEVLHGKPNFPMNWGPTSWLVMGSGGMVSNPRDLKRFVDGLNNGELLSPEASQRLLGAGLLAGGNDRGFLCVYNTDRTTQFFVCSASHSGAPDDEASMIADALWELVRGSLAPFYLGIVFGIEASADGATQVLIEDLTPGGPAAEAGLMVGDRLLSIQGRPLTDPEEQLRGLGKSAAPVPATVERGGEVRELVVLPRRRGH